MLNRIVHHKYFVFFLPIVLLVAISFYLYPEWMNLPPSYVHQWAQADWYAMAMCYAKEDITFGLPRTYALNTSFVQPSHWGQGITRADFPIHAYISGIIMYYSNTFEPFIFRSYTLIFSLIGMLFLFRLIYESSKSILWALCSMLIVFTSPVYAFYQVGFQPVVPCFACFVIAVYFFYNYFKHKKDTILYAAIFFITLSALSRPSFAVYWIAFVLFYSGYSYKHKSFKLYHSLAFLFSFSVQMGSYLYNVHLKNEYGAMFIDFALPAFSIEEYIALMSEAWGTWKYDYFSQPQYVIIIILMVVAVSSIAFNGKLTKDVKLVSLLLLICFLGALSFSFLMAIQFPNHDYYLIDAVLPVLVLVFLVFSEVISVEQKQYANPFAFGIFITCFIFNVADCKTVLDTRSSPTQTNEFELARKQYVGSGEFINMLKVPRNAKILVLNSYTSNIPLLEFDRKGYTIINNEPDSVNKALNFAYEYVVIRTNDVAHMLSISPSMITRFEKVGSNDKISVYKKRAKQDGNIFSFYGVSQENVLLADTSRFDVVQKKYNWDILPERIVKSTSFSKPKSLFIDSLDFIGPMHTFNNVSQLAGKKRLNIILRMKTHFSTANKTIRLAYEVYRKNGKTFESEEILIEDILGSKWQNASCSVNLTLTKTSDIEKVVIFLWNPNKATYFADDIETYMYTE